MFDNTHEKKAKLIQVTGQIEQENNKVYQIDKEIAEMTRDGSEEAELMKEFVRLFGEEEKNNIMKQILMENANNL